MSVLFQDTNPTAIHAEKPTIDLSHAVCTVQNRAAVTVTLCDCQKQLKSYLMEHNLSVSACANWWEPWWMPLPNCTSLIAVF